MKYMQAVLNEQFHFAGGRDYMMRSEKRSGGGPAHRSPAPGGKKPHRKRRRAGFFYKLFMMLLLVTIWPVGLLMLWQRKVRWGVLTKLLASIVTLAVCVMLLGFALTVETGSPQYTAVQDKVNSFLNTAADTLVDFSYVAADKAVEIYENASDFADAAWEYGKVHLANSIDAGVLLMRDVTADAQEWIASVSGQPAPTVVPTEAPTAEPTAEPTPEPTAQPTPEPTPEPVEEKLTFAVKNAADAIVYYNDGGKCYHMTSACASMKSAAEHTFGETRDVNNHRCSICGTPEKTMLDEKYITWLDSEGTAHLSDECIDFKGDWKLITAQSAIEDGAVACMNCEADLYLAALAVEKDVVVVEPTAEPTATPEPTEAPTEEPTEEPAAQPSAEAEAPAESEDSAAQPAETAGAEAAAIEETVVDAETAPAEESISDESAESESDAEETLLPDLTVSEEPTAEPTVEPTEAPAEEPTEAPTQEPTEAPTQEPTEAPTQEPTPEPTPEIIIPQAALKSASQAMVYCGDDSAAYHRLTDCAALTGTSRVLRLEDCVLTMQPCKECASPAADLADAPCLWQDEAGLCHTEDTCARFTGKWTLIHRDDALAAGLAACSECGAEEYLKPGTEIDYAAIITPTPIPTATPNPNAFVYTDILVVDAA